MHVIDLQAPMEAGLSYSFLMAHLIACGFVLIAYKPPSNRFWPLLLILTHVLNLPPRLAQPLLQNFFTITLSLLSKNHLIFTASLIPQGVLFHHA